MLKSKPCLCCDNDALMSVLNPFLILADGPGDSYLLGDRLMASVTHLVKVSMTPGPFLLQNARMILSFFSSEAQRIRPDCPPWWIYMNAIFEGRLQIAVAPTKHHTHGIPPLSQFYLAACFCR